MKKTGKILSMLIAVIITFSAVSASFTVSAEETLPQKYSSVDEGYITDVKNQKSYGTCWAHAALAASEASLIKNNGYSKDTDLSELHLAYCTNHKLYDRMGLFDREVREEFVDTYMSDGSSVTAAAVAMSLWNGPVTDSSHYSQFSSEKFDFEGLNQLDFVSRELQYDMNAAHLTDYYEVSGKDINKIKEYIMKYGAGSISFIAGRANMDNEKGIWFYNEDTYVKAGGHEVCIVGWDDTIPAEELAINGVQPSRDGAFIIKNSWGTNRGQNGYYYVPYEKYMFENNYACFLAFENTDNYDYQYAYDDCVTSRSQNYGLKSDVTMANVFTSQNDDEVLKAVSIFPNKDNIRYEIKIYTDVDKGANSPIAGKLAAVLTGTEEIRGYRTIELEEPLKISKGESFSVTVTLYDNDNSGYPVVFGDFDDYGKITGNMKAGESYLLKDSGWTDMTEVPYGGNPRIRAFTTSESAPKLVEPEDYDSYDGISRDTLISDYLTDVQKINVMNENYLNYNSEDLSRLTNLYSIGTAIRDHSDKFTASEVYAVKKHLEKYISEIRYIDVNEMLGQYQSIALKWSSISTYTDLPQYKEYMKTADRITELAKEMKITNQNYAQLKRELSDSFMILTRYLVNSGTFNSYLQNYGDTDNSGSISISDATKLQMNLAKLIDEDHYLYFNSDADGNGEKDLNDVTVIQQYLSGTGDHLPVYDNTFGVEDGYTSQSSRELIESYLKNSIDERSCWDGYTVTYEHTYHYLKNSLTFYRAKEVFENRDSYTNAHLLFYTRLMRSVVPTEIRENI